MKCVRDRIPELVKKSGRVPICYFASASEIKGFFIEKLKEEIQEFCELPSIEEMVDIIEVLDAFFETIGVPAPIYKHKIIGNPLRQIFVSQEGTHPSLSVENQNKGLFSFDVMHQYVKTFQMHLTGLEKMHVENAAIGMVKEVQKMCHFFGLDPEKIAQKRLEKASFTWSF